MNKKPMPLKSTNSIKRLLQMLIEAYPVLVPVVGVCIVIGAVTASLPAIFQQKIYAIIGVWTESGDWASASKEIIPKVTLLAVLYVISLIAGFAQSQLMAIITQGFLNKMRQKMFAKMQNLPVKYFDTNKHGDIMSHYTNDIDTLRQMVSQSIPTLIRCIILLVCVLCIMLYYSLWLTLVVLLGVLAITTVSKKVGSGSAKFFIRQQKSLGKTEGFIQEMMTGQKVVKVFNHEPQCRDDFRKHNEELFQDAFKAHAYANILGPIIMNIGNTLYVSIAIIGGILLLLHAPNIGLSSLFKGAIAVISIDIVIPFMNMSKQFTGNFNQVAQQINSIAMAAAGAERIFELIDEQPETDDGYVTLVNAVIDEDGNVTEAQEHTGQWAWKHPHGDGTLTYTPLRGDIVMIDVDFSYVPGKQVLHDISLYAKPGQKVDFVGATGAGKTTITNLINRFYDIEDGKIRYDNININKIKKADLRSSLGLILQDTNLFTGTVMDNIRYGKLNATDEECIAAAKLAGADDFITRLPNGYQTMLANNGENLSQGQRQLIGIARAAVGDPPVMIMDEATSSIDTRTERIVQQGMDKLMEGRTVFVIAHRLSTVQNANVIMVLDHGRIIERGSHNDLIAMKGQYYQLYTGAFELE
ncbi:MAG: ABC transporter ATP-binding protein [Anaerolineaceae bacterium]|nr:ABC transporter ATP-binding protein [Anaerolineaceae bacterium]